MDWKKCIVCQEEKSEAVRCPKNRVNSNSLASYDTFLTNLSEFRNLDALPADLMLPQDVTKEELFANDASWHHSCHQKFTFSRLERVKNRKKKEEDNSGPARKSKRQSLETDKNLCLFCGTSTSEKLIEYSTNNAEANLRRIATDLDDTDMLTKISGGDLVAIEAKYHFTCLCTYRNRHRAFVRAQEKNLSCDLQRAKARAMVELLSYVETSIEDGINLFYAKDLRNMYQSRLVELGHNISVNKASFKQTVFAHFEDLGIQDQSDGNKRVYAFPKGLQSVLKSALENRNYREEALLFAKVAKIVRQELLNEKAAVFNGSFPNNCQDELIPSTRLLVSMILYGPNVNGEVRESQACHSISQLCLHNVKRRVRKNVSTSQRHTPLREPPVPLYVGLNVHSLTRNKAIIENLEKLGLSVSYARILQVETLLAHNISKQFQTEGIVCPPSLRRGLYTVGAVDNIDHNPSSTTAEGSLHGTAISVMQHRKDGNEGEERPIVFKQGPFVDDVDLPDSFAIVPACSLNPATTAVPAATTKDAAGFLPKAMAEEQMWIQKAFKLVTQESCLNQAISWAAYHASLQLKEVNPPAIISLLPLFFEKADSPAMIRHGMTLLKGITHFLNPGQIPVLACDCPIFAQCKYIQWKWPEEFGEDKLLIMFGGLHIEKALWNTLGDMLESSGWTVALTEAAVTTSGTADSYLRAAHITRTRHAHQVTALALSYLQREACNKASANPHGKPFEIWHQEMTKKSPTYQFWDLVLRLEMLVLIFIRAHRENNFGLYVESLEALMFIFFALDHYNYSRWVSVHLRDMKSLPDEREAEFCQNWVIQKTSRRFSAIPLDQAHEQENAKVKGKGGVVGLTENPVALKRWMVAGPETARIIEEFEQAFLPEADLDINYRHHEEGASAQEKFRKQASSLIKVINEYGNPFMDDCKELLVLDTRDCVDDSVVKCVREIESLGKEQYQQFKREVLDSRGKSIHAPITKNKLSLFRTRKSKASPKAKQLADLRNNVALFGRLYIANQKRDGDPEVFFRHENQLHPPSLSDHGVLRACKKSDLVNCLDMEKKDAMEREFDCKIFDGAVLVHIIKPTTVATFEEYGKEAFLAFLQRELAKVKRVDVVWDQYLDSSIKGSAREKRGSGVRRKVSPQAKIPSRWLDFLRVAENKVELFAFLNDVVAKSTLPEQKEIHLTSQQSVVSLGECVQMPNCTHEEADTRIIVHLLDAAKNGCKNIVVRTVDTDVLVILVGQFHQIKERHPSIELWLAFGVGKDYTMYSINEICSKFERDVCEALPVFHAFTGCDTTSSFHGKGKKSAWGAWKAYPDITSAFKFIADHPFAAVDTHSPIFSQLERFTVVLYDKTSVLESVNEARRELFCKKNRNLENLPPTQDALAQHIKRVAYQAGIWTTASNATYAVPLPSDWGWEKVDGKWQPVWMTLSEAASACSELIKCHCSSNGKCTRCKCAKAGLPCTELCVCGCER